MKPRYCAFHDDDMDNSHKNRVACVTKDDGNGFQIKFPSYTSVHQEVRMTLDYSQAAYLRECLNQIEGLD